MDALKTLLISRRVLRGGSRELVFEEWADEHGEIRLFFGAVVESGGAASRAMRRLETQIARHNEKESNHGED